MSEDGEMSVVGDALLLNSFTSISGRDEPLPLPMTSPKLFSCDFNST